MSERLTPEQLEAIEHALKRLEREMVDDWPRVIIDRIVHARIVLKAVRSDREQ